MRFSIVVLPGDGIGPEVIGQAVSVLEAVGNRFGHSFKLRYGGIGGAAIDRSGTPLPEETVALLDGADAVLYGAVGGPQWDRTDADVRPEDGILALRKSLDLFANLRPVRALTSTLNASPVRPELLHGVDMIILRELTGGLYYSRPKRRWRTSRGRRGVDTLRYTEQEVERVVRVGFELARGRRGRLTSVDKANVLESSRLWREVAGEVSRDYPEVELEHIYVDNLSMQLIKEPARFDVIVAENTFGDIISDAAAVLAGSLGMLPSASLSGLPTGADPRGRRLSLYEPIHGSAPDIAGQGIANPIGAILSVAMMLRLSLGLDQEAAAVERSVEGALADGYRTPDLAAPGDDVVDTERMGAVITERV